VTFALYSWLSSENLAATNIFNMGTPTRWRSSWR